jgi:hypothetical protein
MLSETRTERCAWIKIAQPQILAKLQSELLTQAANSYIRQGG